MTVEEAIRILVDENKSLSINERKQIIKWLKVLKSPSKLADLLMDKRIYGSVREDITYCKDVIDDVTCELELKINDDRACFCGAELEETWRTRKKASRREVSE